MEAEAGKLISLDKPEESLLLQVLEYAGRLKMPPSRQAQRRAVGGHARLGAGGAPVPADLSVKIRPGSTTAPAAAIAVQNSGAADEAGIQRRREKLLGLSEVFQSASARGEGYRRG